MNNINNFIINNHFIINNYIFFVITTTVIIKHLRLITLVHGSRQSSKQLFSEFMNGLRY